jgi:hypothetical protein
MRASNGGGTNRSRPPKLESCDRSVTLTRPWDIGVPKARACRHNESTDRAITDTIQPPRAGCEEDGRGLSTPPVRARAKRGAPARDTKWRARGRRSKDRCRARPSEARRARARHGVARKRPQSKDRCRSRPSEAARAPLRLTQGATTRLPCPLAPGERGRGSTIEHYESSRHNRPPGARIRRPSSFRAATRNCHSEPQARNLRRSQR